MFNLFGKKDNDIYAPVAGKCLDITECSDKVFSSKVMGDGFLIRPDDKVIKAPCDGKLIMVFPTNHAFGFKMDNGVEVMLHIGIDTVKLNGDGFRRLIGNETKIKKGIPLVELDLDTLQSKGYDCSVMTIMTNIENQTYHKENLDKQVLACERIIKIGA